MNKALHIDIYCVDNDIIALDYFKLNFKSNFKYTLHTFNSVQNFFVKLRSDAKNKRMKIVFIDNIITSRGMNTKTALELIAPIKNINKDIAIVIFADSENFDLNATSSYIRASAFIKRDQHFFIKLQPLISRLISEYELKRKTHSAKIATIISLSLILLCAIGLSIGFIFY